MFTSSFPWCCMETQKTWVISWATGESLFAVSAPSKASRDMKPSTKKAGNQLGKGRLAMPYTFHGLPGVVGFFRASAKLNPAKPVIPTIRATDASEEFSFSIKNAQLCFFLALALRYHWRQEILPILFVCLFFFFFFFFFKFWPYILRNWPYILGINNGNSVAMECYAIYNKNNWSFFLDILSMLLKVSCLFTKYDKRLF